MGSHFSPGDPPSQLGSASRSGQAQERLRDRGKSSAQPLCLRSCYGLPSLLFGCCFAAIRSSSEAVPKQIRSSCQERDVGSRWRTLATGQAEKNEMARKKWIDLTPGSGSLEVAAPWGIFFVPFLVWRRLHVYIEQCGNNRLATVAGLRAWPVRGRLFGVDGEVCGYGLFRGPPPDQ